MHEATDLQDMKPLGCVTVLTLMFAAESHYQSIPLCIDIQSYVTVKTAAYALPKR